MVDDNFIVIQGPIGVKFSASFALHCERNIEFSPSKNKHVRWATFGANWRFVHANREPDLHAVQQYGIWSYQALTLFAVHTYGPRCFWLVYFYLGPKAGGDAATANKQTSKQTSKQTNENEERKN